MAAIKGLQKGQFNILGKKQVLKVCGERTSFGKIRKERKESTEKTLRPYR